MKFLLPISKSIYNMVKYISIILLTLLSSCIITGKWNEMGRKRFSLSRFSLHANKGEEQKIKNMIDLNSTYKKITLSPPPKENYTYQTYIYRFYKDGKVGIFSDYNLDPMRATMGIYEVKNGKLYIEYYWHSVQAGYYRVKIMIESHNEQLLGYSGDYIYSLKKENINGDFSDEPDW